MVFQITIITIVVLLLIIVYELRIHKIRTSHNEKNKSSEKEFYENVLNVVPDPIFVKNDKHQWIYGNEVFSKIIQKRREDYIGKSDYDIFPKEMADIFWQKDSETLDGLKVTENEEKIMMDGKVKDILTKKTPYIAPNGEVLLVGVIRDITERKQQANIIDNLFRLIELSSDLYCIFDLEGSPIYFNSHALDMGFSYEMKNYSEIFDWNYSISDLEEGVRNNNQWEGEAILRNFKTGNPSTYWVRIFKVKGEDDKVISISIVATNLQHRKEVEAKLIYNSKMVSLGEMAGGIAHEINSPLAIISGYSGHIIRMIERNNFNPENILWYSSKIKDTAFRISKIIKSLRSFSGSSDNEQLVETNLDTLIKEVVEFSQEKLRKENIALILEVDEELQISCRPIQVQQVLLNLLNNSIDAIKGSPKPWIKIVTSEVNERISITVIDSGKGIGPLVQAKLMTPFFTTKDVGEGVGLGLSISKGLMESNNGALVYVDDFPNTAFRMIFNS